MKNEKPTLSKGTWDYIVTSYVSYVLTLKHFHIWVDFNCQTIKKNISKYAHLNQSQNHVDTSFLLMQTKITEK